MHPARWTRLLAVGLFAAAVVALSAACGGQALDAAADSVAPGGSRAATPGGYEQTVEVRLGEWFVSTDSVWLSSGPTRFVVRNVGGTVHEFALVRGTGSDAVEIADIEGIAPGAVRELVHDLAPGRYLFACLIREAGPGGAVTDHFDLGMRLEVTVE